MDWLRDEKKVSEFCSKLNLEKLLNDNDGFVRIDDFLPGTVAELILNSVNKLNNWENADGDEDAGEGYNDSIAHRFRHADLDGGGN